MASRDDAHAAALPVMRLIRFFLRSCAYLLVLTAVTAAVTGGIARWQLAHWLQLQDGRLVALEQLLPGSQLMATVTSFGVEGVRPYVRIDNLEWRSADGMRVYAESVSVELDTEETLLRRAPILSRARVDAARVALIQDEQGRWSVPRSNNDGEAPSIDELLWESDRIDIRSLTLHLTPFQQDAVEATLSVQLQNRRGDHRGEIALTCAESCGGTLRYAFDGNPFQGLVNGALKLHLLGVPEVIGVARAGGNWIDFNRLRSDVSATMRKGRMRLHGSAFVSSSVRNEHGKFQLSLDAAGDGNGQDDRWDIRLADLSATLNDRAIDVNGLTLAKRNEAWFAQVPQLEIADVLGPLTASGVLGEIPSRWLKEMAPRGSVADVRAHFAEGVAYAAEITGLTLNGYRGAPEMVGARATLVGHSLGGQLRLHDQPMRFGFPEVFESAWQDVRFEGPIDFWYDKGLTLLSGPLEGDTGDLRLTGRFGLHRPNEQADQALTLLIDLHEGATARVSRYIPATLDAPLRAWLVQAIGEGDLDGGSIAIHSFVNPQPGRRSQVELAFDVSNTKFRFQPEWPAFDKLNGHVELSNRHLTGRVRSSSAEGVRLNDATISVPADSDRLALRGNGSTDTQDLLNFLKNSPVIREAPWLTPWQGAGEFDFDIDASIDLRGREHRVAIDSTHTHTRVRNDELKLDLTDLAGDLHYEQPPRVQAERLVGRLYGEPIAFAIRTDDDGLHFETQGQGDGAWLSHWLPWPVQDVSDGAFDYASGLHIPFKQGAPITLQATSELRGFRLDLPAPLQKDANSVRPVVFDMAYLDGGMSIDVRDPVLDLTARLIRGELKSAAIGVSVPKPPLGVTGIRVEGRPVRAELLKWTALLNAGVVAGSDRGTRLPVLAELRIDEALLGDRVFPDTSLSVRSVDEGLRVNFSQADVQGTLMVFPDQRPLLIELARLRLPRDERPKDELDPDAGKAADPLAAWDISAIPRLDMAITALYYGTELLGNVRFALVPTSEGLELRQLSGVLRGLTFDNNVVQWLRTYGVDYSRYSGQLNMTDVGPVLESFGYAGSVHSDSASLLAEVGWLGSPMNFALSRTEGEAKFSARAGRFIQVTGTGAVRVLGIFDFASIARRARLDFSDVFGKGLSYDSIDADVLFGNGELTFSAPVSIEGPGSNFRLGGRVDLRTGLLDNDMIVTLPISRALPWYAAFAALSNPLAGAGVLVAERLLHNQIDQFSTAKYHVGGTMDAPQVTFVSVFSNDVELDQSNNQDNASQEKP